MLLDHATDDRTEKADAVDLLRMDDDGAGRSETGTRRPTAPDGGVLGADWGVRAERFPASASLAPRCGSEGPPLRTQIVVGAGHKTEAAPSKLQNLLDDDIHTALSRRCLAIGTPDRAERAILRTAADGRTEPHM